MASFIHTFGAFEARRAHDLDEAYDDPNCKALIASQQPLLDQALLVCVHLVRSAMEHGRMRDAKNFLDRIYEHRRHELRSRALESAPPDEDSPVVLDDYILVVIIGWALNLVETTRKAKVKRAATEVLGMAVCRLPKRHRLIWLWESFEDLKRGSSLSQRLGVSNWDPRDRNERIRPGVAYSRAGGDAWLSRGFYFALLKARAPSTNETRSFFVRAPPAHVWNSEGVRPLLTSIVAQHWNGVPDAEQKKVLEDTISLITARELAAKITQIRETATQEIDQKMLDQTQQKIVEVWKKNRAFSHEVLKPAKEQVQSQTSKTELGDWVYALPRAAIVRSVNVVGLEQEVGRDVALRHNIAEFYQAEIAVKESREASLERLPEQIGAAIERLHADGYKPDLVLLPEDDEFVAALFGKPAWEVESGHSLGRFFVGEWNGLKVARWPYTDSEAILIADTSRFFATTSDVEVPPEIEIKPEDPAVTNEIIAKAERATSAQEMPSAMEIRFLMTVRTKLFYRVADVAAGVKLPVARPGEADTTG